MIYPVNYIGISQYYHVGKCLDFGWNSKHGGPNVPIYSCDNGKVVAVEKQNKGGNVVYIEHDKGIVSCYAHLSKVLVKKGDIVKLAQQIGNMGCTGSSATGNHLHFGLYSSFNKRYGNSDLDPFNYCEVYGNQIIGDTTKSKYGNKFKKHTEKEFTTGTYETLSELNVRKGPGTNYDIKKVSELTADGKKNATSTDLNHIAEYKKGTRFTAQEIIENTNKSIWARTPSGYVCLKGSTGNIFVKKVI